MQVLFSDTAKCEKCGVIDFFRGLVLCGSHWLCAGCSKSEEQPEQQG